MKGLRTLLVKNFHYLCIVSVIAFGLITIVGSGGGGGGGSPTPDPTPDPTCVDVSGTWNTTELVNGTDCGDGTYTNYNEFTVTQSGCNITVDAGAYGTHSGTVNGSQITYTGSYPEEGGTTTINVNLTVSGNSLSGSSTWTWRNGTSCSGTTQISGTKQLVAGCGQGLPLTISNLSFPGTGTAGQSYDGSVDYQGSFEDISNPIILLKVPFQDGTAYTRAFPDPTASNCSIDFKGTLPSTLSGTGPAYFKLVDYDSTNDDLFYNWDNNGVSNQLSQTVTISQQ